MATYDFKCQKCKKVFEQIVPIGTKEIKCKICGHKTAKKIISSPGIIFKGGGFYRTDNRKNNDCACPLEKKEGNSCPKKDECCQQKNK